MTSPRRARSVLVALAGAIALASTGCTRGGDSHPTAGGWPGASCGSTTYADPWPALTNPLQDGDTLEVGTPGWVEGSSAKDVTATPSSLVIVSDQRSPMQYECGVASDYIDWIEVEGIAAGTVELTIAGNRMTVHIVD